MSLNSTINSFSSNSYVSRHPRHPKRIIREFELLEDWPERYKYIIKLGMKLEPLDETYKTEDNLVRGCQSQVWLATDLKDGTVFFKADSDAAATSKRNAEPVDATSFRPICEVPAESL